MMPDAHTVPQRVIVGVVHVLAPPAPNVLKSAMMMEMAKLILVNSAVTIAMIAKQRPLAQTPTLDTHAHVQLTQLNVVLENQVPSTVLLRDYHVKKKMLDTVVSVIT